MKNIKFTHILIVLAIAGLAYYLWNESKKKEDQEAELQQNSAGTVNNNGTSGVFSSSFKPNPFAIKPAIKPFFKPSVNMQVSNSALLKN